MRLAKYRMRWCTGREGRCHLPESGHLRRIRHFRQAGYQKSHIHVHHDFTAATHDTTQHSYLKSLNNLLSSKHRRSAQHARLENDGPNSAAAKRQDGAKSRRTRQISPGSRVFPTVPSGPSFPLEPCTRQQTPALHMSISNKPDAE